MKVIRLLSSRMKYELKISFYYAGPGISISSDSSDDAMSFKTVRSQWTGATREGLSIVFIHAAGNTGRPVRII